MLEKNMQHLKKIENICNIFKYIINSFKMNNIIYGILEINNKVSFGTKNEKRFFPHDKTLPIFYVPTKKVFSPINLYCGIKYTKNDNDKYYGNIEKYIGELGNLEAELEYLKNIGINSWIGNSKFKLDDYFEDHTPIRQDLTHLNTYSIDPNNCVDIDDAISIEFIDNKYKIYIHIADVSSYILPNTQLDLEIKKRCESIYLNKFQVNMIPDKLSINNMSLLENKINRAFTLEIIVDNEFNIISHEFYKSLINVKNLSYDNAQKLIKTNNDLKLLYNLGKKFYENKFGINPDYNTHHMVEIFMIIANVYAAIEIKDYDEAIFRKQNINSQKLALDLIIDFNPAFYTYKSNDNIVHHSTLNEDLYTHFTSPMRRYIDITVHRLLSNKFCGTNFEITKDDLFIENLNKIHKKYKKISLTSQLYCNIFDAKFKECDIYEGVICGFSDNKINVFVKNLGILNIKLFDKKMSELYKFQINNNSYTLFDLENKKTTEYLLNQTVSLKISITKYSPKKLNPLFL